MTFGEKLYVLRKKANMSQEDLGQKLKVSRQTIFKWETNAACPEYKKIKEICLLFGVSADYLIFDEKGEEQNGQEVLPDQYGQAEQCENVAVLCDCNQDDTAKLIDESEVACCEDCAQVDTTDIAQTEQDDKTKAKAKSRKIAKTICKIYNYFARLFVSISFAVGVFVVAGLFSFYKIGINTATCIAVDDNSEWFFVYIVAFAIIIYVWTTIKFLERRSKNGKNS